MLSVLMLIAPIVLLMGASLLIPGSPVRLTPVIEMAPSTLVTAAVELDKNTP